MDQTEKLLMGIENILSVASDLVDEVGRLKRVEEECKILKEKLFLKQFTEAEQEVFTLAIDGHSTAEMQKMLVREESTVRTHRKNIIQKLNVSSMKEAVQQFKNIHGESPQKLIRIS